MMWMYIVEIIIVLWIMLGLINAKRMLKEYKSNPNYELFKNDKKSMVLYYIMVIGLSILLAPLALIDSFKKGK